LQRGQLAVAIIDRRADRIERLLEVGYDWPGAGCIRFRPADRRWMIKIELAAIEPGNLGQVPAEGVESQEPRLHLADPGCQRTELVVDDSPGSCQHLALGRQILVPARDREIAQWAVRAQTATGDKGAGQQG